MCHGQSLRSASVQFYGFNCATCVVFLIEWSVSACRQYKSTEIKANPENQHFLYICLDVKTQQKSAPKVSPGAQKLDLLTSELVNKIRRHYWSQWGNQSVPAARIKDKAQILIINKVHNYNKLKENNLLKNYN